MLVQDAITSLLKDPTLDELLAMLERESELMTDLRIPTRPSNLTIIDDWLNPRRGCQSGRRGVFQQLLQQQLQRNEERTSDDLRTGYQTAVERALMESQMLGQIKGKKRSNAQRKQED